jgi:hypothetical protein
MLWAAPMDIEALEVGYDIPTLLGMDEADILDALSRARP